MMETVPEIVKNCQTNPGKVHETLKILSITRTKLQPVLSNSNKFSMTVKDYLQGFNGKLGGCIKRLSDVGKDLETSAPKLTTQNGTYFNPFDSDDRNTFQPQESPFGSDGQLAKDTNPFSLKFSTGKPHHQNGPSNTFTIEGPPLDSRRPNSNLNVAPQKADFDFLSLDSINPKSNNPFESLPPMLGKQKQDQKKPDSILDLDFL
jgi:hypothetical protein